MLNFAVVSLFVFFCHIAFAQIPPTPLKSEKEVNAALFSIYQYHWSNFSCQQSSNSRFSTLDVKNIQKENKIDWVLLVSKKSIASNRPCYEQKICINRNGERYRGILCCKNIDPLYNIMVHDLHNRLPMVHHIAKNMHTYRFDTITDPNESDIIYYPNCAFKFHTKQKVLEPHPQLKGEIARIFLYMKDTYHLTFQDSQVELFKKWHREHPASQWEQQKNKAIQKIQGNLNPYIG